jgi:RHS repeat-associated protein
MPGRSFNRNDYRYGFNGMEKDDKGCGCGGDYTSEYRQLDTRLGKWWSIDPMASKFAGQSPYNNNFNNPISLKDPKGDCPFCIPLIIGAVAMIIDASMQASVSYAVNPEAGWSKALSNVDWFDATITGMVAFATYGTASEMTIGRTSYNAVLRAASASIASGEILKATIDYKPFSENSEESLKVSLYNKSGTETAFDLTFGMAGNAFPEEILSVFKQESKAGLDAFEGLQPDAKWLDPDLKQAKYIDGVANSNVTQQVVEKTSSFGAGAANEVSKKKLGVGQSSDGSSGSDGSGSGSSSVQFNLKSSTTYGTTPKPQK